MRSFRLYWTHQEPTVLTGENFADAVLKASKSLYDLSHLIKVERLARGKDFPPEELCVLFLDIDGVFNSHRYFKRRSREECDLKAKTIYQSLTQTQRDLDDEAVSLLKEFCDIYQPLIVISSSWRIARELKEIQEALKARGFDNIHDFECDVTGRVSGGCRGDEIEKKIREIESFYKIRRLCRYAIIDDDSDMLLSQRENFFHVDREYGVSHNTFYKIGRLLDSRRNIVTPIIDEF